MFTYLWFGRPFNYNITSVGSANFVSVRVEIENSRLSAPPVEERGGAGSRRLDHICSLVYDGRVARIVLPVPAHWLHVVRVGAGGDRTVEQPLGRNHALHHRLFVI